MTPDDVRGIAVHTAARVMGAAGPGEVLMSATVSSTRRRLRARVRGAGRHELKGLAGTRQLYRLVDPAA